MMWLLRLLIRDAEPRARGIDRLKVTPLLTETVFMKSFSTSFP